MICIRESKKSSSMRKDTRRDKFLFWQKNSKFFVFSLKIDIIRWPFRNPSKNENPTKTKNVSIWLSTTVRVFKWRWKRVWNIILVFFAYYQNDSKFFWKKIFSIKMWCFHKYFTDIEQKMEENLGIFGWLQERQNVNCFFKKDRYHGDWPPNLVGNTFE